MIDDRRVFIKYVILSPVAYYSVDSSAFIPGLIVRFLLKRAAKYIFKKSIKRIRRGTKPKTTSRASKETTVSSKYYTIKTESSSEKLYRILDNIDSAYSKASLAKEVWNKHEENKSTLLVAHNSDSDFHVPDINVNLLDENGKKTTVKIPSTVLKPNEGYAIELGYSGLPSGKNQFSVQQGTASKLFEKVLVSDAIDYSKEKRTLNSDEKSNGKASELCEQILDKC